MSFKIYDVIKRSAQKKSDNKSNNGATMPLNVNEEYNFIELEAEGLKPYY
jgi:hypothetical protein